MLINLRWRNNIIILLPVAIAMVAVFVLLFFMKSHGNPRDASRAYYYDHLGSLDEKIKTIKEIVERGSREPGEQIKAESSDGIEAYENALLRAQEVCRQLGTYKAASEPADNLADRVSSVNSLCRDLEGVLDYAYRLSLKSKEFLLYTVGPADKPTAEIGSDATHSLRPLLDTTSSALMQLKSDPMNDPALPELIAYIETVQKSVNSSSDSATISAALKTQQINVINARRYFWKTTIKINDLDSSITDLQQKFK